MSAADQYTDLGWGRTVPTRAGFLELAAERRVVPVVRRLLADAETPIGVYRKLAADAPGTFLLESAEHGGIWSRYSIIGAASPATLTERSGQAYWIGEPPAGVPTGGCATEALHRTVSALATPRLPGLPPLTGGMVGVVGYDAVRAWERLPQVGQDTLHLPELAMMLAGDVAVLDHLDGAIYLIANAVDDGAAPERAEQAWSDAVARLDAMQHRLVQPSPSTVAVGSPREVEADSTHTPAEYERMVRSCQEAIRAGEAFQIVVSQRFAVPCPADPLDVYRALRASNPSPYMYLLRLPHPDGSTYAVVGSSPEALVKVTDGQVITHPIAGSRPRGGCPEEDRRLERELLADPKERAEHLMLVDLARNDLQRVCEPGTVDTLEFMQVSRYSHIMHLESTVSGRMRAGKDAYDVLVATFPAGTLSGAPKTRAMSIIEELEGSRRGVYGGVVGYFDFAGDLDMAIAIRTAVIRDGTAFVQAGAGIVADSVPATEYQETRAKAAAVLRAVAVASGMRRAQ